MKRRGTCLLLGLMMLLSILPALAQASESAQVYSLPLSGLRLEAGEGWTVLTPSSLSEAAAFLSQLGVDPEVLAADYAANHTVLEVYLPGGPQVRIDAVATEDTAAWQSMAMMREADKASLLAGMDQAPRENVRWDADSPGYIRYDWTLEAGGTPVAFAGLATVAQGMLYTLTASGAELSTGSLHEANAMVLSRLTFLGSTLDPDEEIASIVLPRPVEDDGAVTPIAMVDFDGITYEETTSLVIQTLPNADLTLRTATDALRGRADEAGRHTFRVSTRRESLYTYTITAESEGRKASQLEIALDRQLTPEAKEDAYRRSAQQIETYGYGNLIGAPDAYAGRPITFRGRVEAFADLEGFPCALVYTENPGRGVWKSPMWVLLTEAIQLEKDDMRTVYGDLRGDTLPYTDMEGNDQVAPVVVGRSLVE